MAVKCLCFNLLILSSIFVIYANGDDEPQCKYEIHVKTGTINKAGTDAKISLTLVDSSGGDKLVIPNLEDWGKMGSDHDYFEKGNLDRFGGVGRCLNGPACEIKLKSDGTGEHPDWYCDYVLIYFKIDRLPCLNHFIVERWFAMDKPPYELDGVVDNCSSLGGSGANHGLTV